MRVSSFSIATTLLLSSTYLAFAERCHLDPGLRESRINSDPLPLVYTYVPFGTLVNIGDNSLIIYDERAAVIDCINVDEIVQSKIRMGDDSYRSVSPGDLSIFYGKLIDKDTLVLSLIDNSSLGKNRYIFLDHYFRPLSDLADLEFSPKLNDPSSIFHLGMQGMQTKANPHDCLLLSDGVHTIIFIDEVRNVTDKVSDLFPELDNDFSATAAGLLVFDRKTEKWLHFLDMTFLLISQNLMNMSEENIDLMKTGYNYRGISPLELLHTNSLVEVSGDHWLSKSLEGKRTFLISHMYGMLIDLFVWEFEKQENPYFIWRWPSVDSAPALIEQWLHKWEVVGDPFGGVSHTHDINVYNLSPGHIIAIDNGYEHRGMADDGSLCSISRVVEYKISENGSGRYKAELVYSFPKLEEYPKIADPTLPMSFLTSLNNPSCAEFWHDNVYMILFGSVIRLPSGDTCFTWFDIGNYQREDTFPFLKRPPIPNYSGTIMATTDSEGNLKTSWNNTAQGHITYKINPFPKAEFRVNMKYQVI